jgi:hypothetical protein
MMTDRTIARRHAALWLIAPVAAGVFGVTTDWAVRHNPLADKAEAAPATTPQASADAAPRGPEGLEAKLAAATKRYAATRQDLLALEHSLRRGAAELASLRGGSAAATSGSSRPVTPQAPPAAPAPPPAPPAAPPAPPPPVDTSTGAS